MQNIFTTTTTKKTRLYSRAVSKERECVIDTEYSVPTEVIEAERNYTGQIWSGNDQCKMIYGPNAVMNTVNITFFEYETKLFKIKNVHL
jgi:hypothetical protein